MRVKFERKVGGLMVAREDERTLMVIHGDQTPNTVHVPRTVPADLGGGRELRVLHAHTSACACGRQHVAKHLDLERGLSVAECAIREEFMWYRTPPKEAGNES